MRLTGWQRSWVVFSVLSLVTFIVVAIFMWPKPQLIDPYILDLINQPEKCAGRSEKRGQISNNLPDIDGMKLDLNCFRIEKIKKTNPDIRTEDDYIAHVRAEDKRTRLYWFGLVALSWLSLVVFVYLAGWTVVWVVRGFKGS